MSASPVPDHAVPDGAVARLERLVELLVSAHRPPGGRPGSLVRVRGVRQGPVELAMKPVEPHDVYGSFVTSSVPDRWEAAGFVVWGTARPIHLVNRPDPSTTSLGLATAALLVRRDGVVASCMQLDGQPPHVQVDATGSFDLPRDCTGRLVDVVRRSLGLATPPPRIDVSELAARVWLHRIHTAAVSAMSFDVALVDALAPPLPGSWRAVRDQRAGGAWPEVEVPSEHAAWMDDGMFARAAIASFPEPADLVAELAELVPLAAWEHLLSALARSIADGGSTDGNLGARAR
jgi:hypothetical protein